MLSWAGAVPLGWRARRDSDSTLLTTFWTAEVALRNGHHIIP